MAEGLVGGALVRGLDDDGLPAGVSAPEEQDHLACLHNLSHLGIWKQMLCFSDIDVVSGWVTITMMTRHSLFALLGLDLPQVELELLALQDVAVGPPALPGPGGDGGEHTT